MNFEILSLLSMTMKPLEVHVHTEDPGTCLRKKIRMEAWSRLKLTTCNQHEAQVEDQVSKPAEEKEYALDCCGGWYKSSRYLPSSRCGLCYRGRSNHEPFQQKTLSRLLNRLTLVTSSSCQTTKTSSWQLNLQQKFWNNQQ